MSEPKEEKPATKNRRTSGTLYLCRWQAKPGAHPLGRLVELPRTVKTADRAAFFTQKLTELANFPDYDPEQPYRRIELISITKVE